MASRHVWKTLPALLIFIAPWPGQTDRSAWLCTTCAHPHYALAFPPGAVMLAKLAIIWMHGLGDRGSSWRSMQTDMAEVGVPIKWQFPDAPVAAVTCNDGYQMTSWFDIEEIPVMPGAKDYPDDIEASVKRIHAMIEDLEKEGYDPREIVLGGFSQGGAMSMQAVLRYPKRLGGAICLSGWLMMPQSLVKWSSPANKATPIFWGHGEEDGVVQYALQAVGVAALKEHEIGSVTDKSYRRMQHSTNSAEMQDVAYFLKSLTS